MFTLHHPAIKVITTSLLALLVSESATAAERGQESYDQSCSACHGGQLEGSEAGAALTGHAFRSKWIGESVTELDKLIRTTMPLSDPGGLAETEYASILAFILQQNDPSVASVIKSPRRPESEMVEWLHHRGSPGSSNYSPLDIINGDNVSGLEIAWRWRSDNFGPGIHSNLQTTPIMADGVLYATAGSRRDVVAIDAVNGETLWMYRLDEGERGKNAPRKGAGRGVAIWREADDTRIFYITPGYQLVSLDARTGRPLPDFGQAGIVDLKTALDPDVDRTNARIGASSPPIIVGNVIIVGAAFPAGFAPPSMNMTKGPVSAYDIHTGEQLWVFNTIPKIDAFGADTWDAGSASYTGNTGVWTPMSADLELGYVYLPVEAATGDFYGGHRPGDNLFSQSIVCLDAATGRRVWHFQIVHHGVWDYDPPAPPVLIDVEHDGVVIPAVVQLTKQGFAFAFDRRDGTPLWPIEERRVPASTTPGEQSAATQPFPALPKPFARQGVDETSFNNLTPEIYAEALRIAAGYTSGPLYTPPSVVSEASGGTLFAPSAGGGGNWQGGVADPETGIMYVASTNTIGLAALVPAVDESDMSYIGNRQKIERPFGLPLARPPWGTITAIDFNSGQHVWQIANGDTPAYVSQHPKLSGIDIPRTGHDDRAGLLVTRSLLFAGEGGGLYVATEGGTKLRAHDKATGEILAEIELNNRQTGMPMTYAVDGQQFIVVAAGAPNQAGELIAVTVKGDHSP